VIVLPLNTLNTLDQQGTWEACSASLAL